MPKRQPRSLSLTAWRSVERHGTAVEKAFQDTGVDLTMGGEPTFVPFSPEGAEWATDALGPTKLDYARRFATRLIRDFHPGSVLLETTGKHYPGEPLPRWNLQIQWLRDGRPLWRNIRRLRDNDKPGKHTLAQISRFIESFAEALGVPGFSRAVNDPTPGAATGGFVLPLDFHDNGWISDRWTARNRKISIFPGDSHYGLRLPLENLRHGRLRRALTVELRRGVLTCFIPPLYLDAYRDLLTKLEATLEKLDIDGIVLAGYAPVSDPDWDSIGLASDPGVIEVNLAVCRSWKDYHEQITRLYKTAEAVGLCGRKLQFNGRQTGTGGGAHLCFGGSDPQHSPFFTRPDLLPSVIRYWQRHPALSYVFTGQFMGPSSQAPRIDESTFETLYELEIACAGAEQSGRPCNRFLYDLLFRDLLMDRTGNTHRAEISVDKLWNQNQSNGRSGIIELRAFESFPDPAALSLIALFVRTVMARLARDPFTEPFHRWHGELHDKYFLPSFLNEDLITIVEDLHAHGFPAFKHEWLLPTWEFRFPALGQLKTDDGEITFRQALEAWPVLAEQSAGGTTSRSVDSSLDRIEASLSNPEMDKKGLLLVNGYPVSFRHERDTLAAGIRFRAFYFVPGLHPHVPVHAPLLLEWVDRETFRVLAAARWHTWSPSGQPYSGPPNSAEAAAKRMAERWEPWTMSLGTQRYIPSIDYPPEGRHTLDLRRYPSQIKT